MPAPHWPQKVLLHDHMDGSFPLLSILPQLHKMSGKKYPFNQFSGHHEAVTKWFRDPQKDIVEKFSLTTGVMQSSETLALAAETYVLVRARQGFKYCEFTIAPQYHTFGGLNEKQVVDALVEGIMKGEEQYPDVEVNILFTVGREVSSEEAVRLVEMAGRCSRAFVVGIGLVCDEAGHPPEKHIAMFERAKSLGFKTTCHAGEWTTDDPKFPDDLPNLIANVRTAIYGLKVDRIGHAIGLPYDAELMKEVFDRGIGIEGCPGSNFASGLVPNTKALRIREILEAGISYSIHPDDDLFLPSLNETYQMCDVEYGFTEREKALLLGNAWADRFGSRKRHR
ncbi:MAG: hypothetical protein WED06_02900 [Candidatus Paceibacterota bacterium]